MAVCLCSDSHHTMSVFLSLKGCWSDAEVLYYLVEKFIVQWNFFRVQSNFKFHFVSLFLSLRIVFSSFFFFDFFCPSLLIYSSFFPYYFFYSRTVQVLHTVCTGEDDVSLVSFVYHDNYSFSSRGFIPVTATEATGKKK